MVSKKSAPAIDAGTLTVKDDEDAWTAEELDAVRHELNEDVERVNRELAEVATDLQGLLRDSGDGAGDDQADVGNANFERDHEISLARKSAEILRQSQRALERIDDGTYGVCESCGEPIGKLRLQAFPRATLCMTCKTKQERR